VDSLVALRGIDKIAAMVLLAELGDISRFASPRQLMAYLGLVPSEHSSGGRRRQGAITRTVHIPTKMTADSDDRDRASHRLRTGVVVLH
jgi:hypothetical protein